MLNRDEFKVQKVRELANENDIYIVENKPLVCVG